MNCPTCNAKGRTTDSRPTAEGTMRRYTCVAGHKWRTLEQLEIVYDASYVHSMRVETGKRLAAAANAIRLARP